MSDDIKLKPLDGDESDKPPNKQTKKKPGRPKAQAPDAGTEPARNEDATETLRKEVEALKEQLQALAASGGNVSTSGGVGLDATTFERILRSVKTETADEWYKYYEEVEVDKDDYLEPPVRFFANSTGYVIVDKVSHGRPVLTPYKRPIIFLYQGRRITGNRKAKDIQTFCSYDCKSQKELDWLRTHPFYGVKFFEDAKKALNQDALKANKIVSYVQQYNKKDAGFVRRQLENLQIVPTKDPHMNRILLADYYASRDMEDEIKEQQKRAAQISEHIQKIKKAQEAMAQ